MALTVESQQRLDRVGLTAFFDKSKPEWCRKARASFEFVANNFPPTSKDSIHPDDVSKALFTLIEVNEALSTYLGAHKLHQKYWLSDFCDLILDRCWAELRPAGKTK
jgi:hypothetical protein